MSIGEVYGGIRPGEEQAAAGLFSSVRIYPVNIRVAQTGGLLKSGYARKGRTLALIDMVIAATAITYDLQLLTDNRKHFDLSELTLFPLS